MKSSNLNNSGQKNTDSLSSISDISSDLSSTEDSILINSDTNISGNHDPQSPNNPEKTFKVPHMSYIKQDKSFAPDALRKFVVSGDSSILAGNESNSPISDFNTGNKYDMFRTTPLVKTRDLYVRTHNTKQYHSYGSIFKRKNKAIKAKDYFSDLDPIQNESLLNTPTKNNIDSLSSPMKNNSFNSESSKDLSSGKGCQQHPTSDSNSTGDGETSYSSFTIDSMDSKQIKSESIYDSSGAPKLLDLFDKKKMNAKTFEYETSTISDFGSDETINRPGVFHETQKNESGELKKSADNIGELENISNNTFTNTNEVQQSENYRDDIFMNVKEIEELDDAINSISTSIKETGESYDNQDNIFMDVKETDESDYYRDDRFMNVKETGDLNNTINNIPMSVKETGESYDNQDNIFMDVKETDESDYYRDDRFMNVEETHGLDNNKVEIFMSTKESSKLDNDRGIIFMSTTESRRSGENIDNVTTDTEEVKELGGFIKDSITGTDEIKEPECNKNNTFMNFEEKEQLDDDTNDTFVRNERERHVEDSKIDNFMDIGDANCTRKSDSDIFKNLEKTEQHEDIMNDAESGEIIILSNFNMDSQSNHNVSYLGKDGVIGGPHENDSTPSKNIPHNSSPTCNSESLYDYNSQYTPDQYNILYVDSNASNISSSIDLVNSNIDEASIKHENSEQLDESSHNVEIFNEITDIDCSHDPKGANEVDDVLPTDDISNSSYTNELEKELNIIHTSDDAKIEVLNDSSHHMTISEEENRTRTDGSGLDNSEEVKALPDASNENKAVINESKMSSYDIFENSDVFAEFDNIMNDNKDDYVPSAQNINSLRPIPFVHDTLRDSDKRDDNIDNTDSVINNASFSNSEILPFNKSNDNNEDKSFSLSFSESSRNLNEINNSDKKEMDSASDLYYYAYESYTFYNYDKSYNTTNDSIKKMDLTNFLYSAINTSDSKSEQNYSNVTKNFPNPEESGSAISNSIPEPEDYDNPNDESRLDKIVHINEANDEKLREEFPRITNVTPSSDDPDLAAENTNDSKMKKEADNDCPTDGLKVMKEECNVKNSTFEVDHGDDDLINVNVVDVSNISNVPEVTPDNELSEESEVNDASKRVAVFSHKNFLVMDEYIDEKNESTDLTLSISDIDPIDTNKQYEVDGKNYEGNENLITGRKEESMLHLEELLDNTSLLKDFNNQIIELSTPNNIDDTLCDNEIIISLDDSEFKNDIDHSFRFDDVFFSTNQLDKKEFEFGGVSEYDTKSDSVNDVENEPKRVKILLGDDQMNLNLSATQEYDYSVINNLSDAFASVVAAVDSNKGDEVIQRSDNDLLINDNVSHDTNKALEGSDSSADIGALTCNNSAQSIEENGVISTRATPDNIKNSSDSENIASQEVSLHSGLTSEESEQLSTNYMSSSTSDKQSNESINCMHNELDVNHLHAQCNELDTKIENFSNTSLYTQDSTVDNLVKVYPNDPTSADSISKNNDTGDIVLSNDSLNSSDIRIVSKGGFTNLNTENDTNKTQDAIELCSSVQEISNKCEFTEDEHSRNESETSHHEISDEININVPDQHDSYDTLMNVNTITSDAENYGNTQNNDSKCDFAIDGVPKEEVSSSYSPVVQESTIKTDDDGTIYEQVSNIIDSAVVEHNTNPLDSYQIVSNNDVSQHSEGDIINNHETFVGNNTILNNENGENSIGYATGDNLDGFNWTSVQDKVDDNGNVDFDNTNINENNIQEVSEPKPSELLHSTSQINVHNDVNYDIIEDSSNKTYSSKADQKEFESTSSGFVFETNQADIHRQSDRTSTLGHSPVDDYGNRDIETDNSDIFNCESVTLVKTCQQPEQYLLKGNQQMDNERQFVDHKNDDDSVNCAESQRDLNSYPNIRSNTDNVYNSEVFMFMNSNKVDTDYGQNNDIHNQYIPPSNDSHDLTSTRKHDVAIDDSTKVITDSEINQSETNNGFVGIILNRQTESHETDNTNDSSFDDSSVTLKQSSSLTVRDPRKSDSDTNTLRASLSLSDSFRDKHSDIILKHNSELQDNGNTFTSEHNNFTVPLGGSYGDIPHNCFSRSEESKTNVPDNSLKNEVALHDSDGVISHSVVQHSLDNKENNRVTNVTRTFNESFTQIPTFNNYRSYDNIDTVDSLNMRDNLYDHNQQDHASSDFEFIKNRKVRARSKSTHVSTFSVPHLHVDNTNENYRLYDSRSSVATRRDSDIGLSPIDRGAGRDFILNDFSMIYNSNSSQPLSVFATPTNLGQSSHRSSEASVDKIEGFDFSMFRIENIHLSEFKVCNNIKEKEECKYVRKSHNYVPYEATEHHDSFDLDNILNKYKPKLFTSNFEDEPLDMSFEKIENIEETVSFKTLISNV